MGYYTNKRIVQLDFDASVNEDLSGMAKELILTSTEGCYIRINEATVTVVNGFYIPADSSITIPLTKASSISAIKETTAGKLTVLELF